LCKNYLAAKPLRLFPVPATITKSQRVPQPSDIRKKSAPQTHGGVIFAGRFKRRHPDFWGEILDRSAWRHEPSTPWDADCIDVQVWL
jgi:hypothetical protein